MSTDHLFQLYILLLAGAFSISYLVGFKGIKESGVFLPYTIFSLLLNLVLMLTIIVWWVVSFYGVNEFSFFMGLRIGAIVLVGAEVTLITCLVLSNKYLSSKSGDKTLK